MAKPLQYAVCPQCGRAVPLGAGERYCLNDGTRLLAACARCGAGIPSPYARHCGQCGAPLWPDGTERSH